MGQSEEGERDGHRQRLRERGGGERERERDRRTDGRTQAEADRGEKKRAREIGRGGQRDGGGRSERVVSIRPDKKEGRLSVKLRNNCTTLQKQKKTKTN